MNNRYKLLIFLLSFFILPSSFLFGKETNSQENDKRSILFTKNIFLKSKYIDLTIKDCISKKAYKQCSSNNSFKYSINDTIKNNILLWIYSEFMENKYNRVFLKQNGIRLIQDDKVFNIYNSNTKLNMSDYDGYDSFNESTYSFLEKNRVNILNALKLSSKEDNKDISKVIDNSFAFFVYLPKIKGNIETDKITNNGSIHYSVQVSLDIKATFIINKSNLNNNNLDSDTDKENNTLETEVSEILLLKFEEIPTDSEFQDAVFRAMKFAFRATSKKIEYKFKNTKYKNDSKKNNDFTQTSSIMIGAGLEPLNVKHINKLSLSKSPDNALIVKLGYSFNLSVKNNLWINTYLSLGTVDKLKSKNKITELKNPLYASFNVDITKRLYLGLSDLYVSPLLGAGIASLYAKNNAPDISLFIANYYYFIGAEIAYKFNSSNDISLWIYNSISYKSKFQDEVPYVETYSNSDKGEPYINNGMSFGMFYRYYFSPN